MFYFRDYEETDASTILSWISDEKTFRQWSADKYKNYPAVPEDMNGLYCSMISQGAKPLVFCHNDAVIGHFLIRVLPENEADSTVRFGFIIVDTTVRGKGYGRKMLNDALEYAFTKMGADRVTLGVFENNTRAQRCYESVGFTQYGETIYNFCDEEWKCIELECLKQS